MARKKPKKTEETVATSEELLKKQDVDNAIEFLKRKHPDIVDKTLPGFEVMSVIGHLLRENRMLANLVKSDESGRIPHLQTSDSKPPFDEQPKFEQPCRAVDVAAGRVRETPANDVRVAKGFDLNPASIRRIRCPHDQFAYRKRNAGRIKKFR